MCVDIILLVIYFYCIFLKYWSETDWKFKNIGSMPLRVSEAPVKGVSQTC